MGTRLLKDNVYWVGAIDWDRRLFDSLIPLPDGTSYNAYLVRGSEKTVLLDTVDPTMAEVLLSQLESVPNVDFVVAHHAEQDHSGTLPLVLEKYPLAKVLTSQSAKRMLVDLLCIPEERIVTVADGETLSLGDRTLEFIYTPWVHWPETMVTYLKEAGILFSCDFFGSHLASSELYSSTDDRVQEATKRYYAEIMMPFRKAIQKNLEKIKGKEIHLIAPSHGPVHDKPAEILGTYRNWVSDAVSNQVVIPYISMHGSTKKMVEHLVSALVGEGVTVFQFDLAVTDIGKVAIALVDAATLVIGTPIVHAGAHPLVFYAAGLVNALRPKLKYASVIGSFGWGGKVVEQIQSLIPNLQVELLEPVMCKGFPREKDFKALEDLAATIVEKHKLLAAA